MPRRHLGRLIGSQELSHFTSRSNEACQALATRAPSGHPTRSPDHYKQSDSEDQGYVVNAASKSISKGDLWISRQCRTDRDREFRAGCGEY